MFSLVRTFIMFVFLSLTACGFHTRGSAPLSPVLQNLYLQSKEPYSKLTQSLRQYFKMSHIHLTDSARDATTILNIVKEDLGQQLLSVGGTQETRQYTISVNVTFQLLNSKGVILLDNQTVSESRSLTIQSSQILGGSNEANNMYQQMREAVAYDIVNRLSSQDVTTVLTQHQKQP